MLNFGDLLWSREPPANFLVNPRKLQEKKKNQAAKHGGYGNPFLASDCRAPSSPRDTSWQRRQPPLSSSARGAAREGGAGNSFGFENISCHPDRLGVGSVSPGTVRVRTWCAGATAPLPPCAELTNHGLKTREGNHVVLNGRCVVALAQICLH